MGESATAPCWSAVPLFHVAARALPVGEALRPYAVAQEYAALLRLAERALEVGPKAVGHLLAGDSWRSLVQEGGYQAEMVLMEAIFERVRGRIAPRAPSRLEAVYAWGNLALARRFRATYRRDGIIHRCALVAGTAVERDGALVVEAFEAADLGYPSADDLRRVEERAVRYWEARAPMAFPELVVRGTVVVEAIVDADEEAWPD
jgi:hypothetical protein